MAIYRAVGLMSGTSMDGVDVALIETDGARSLSLGPTFFQPYDDSDRALLRRALVDATRLRERTERPGSLAEAERVITQRHADAVRAFLREHDLTTRDVDLVGFHGQTVLHRPDERLTVQIGDGAALARRLGVPVVYDFRAHDVTAGGQGAPLVPVFHAALAAAANLETPLALLNIGGVANLTWIATGRDPVACDTGPGNALIDDLMLARTGAPVDRDGATAARGRVDQTALAKLLDHPFFAAPPPKSLDRNAFSRRAVEDLSVEDAAATLVAFTAEAVARILPMLPARPNRIVVCGGGARNPTLMRALRERTGLPVETAETFGWSADAMEAQAFAYLAVRSLASLPLTFPTTTGVAAPTTGGVLAQP